MSGPGAKMMTAIVDPDTSLELLQRRWYLSSKGYAVSMLYLGLSNGRKKFQYVSLARLLVGLEHGDNRQVDHRNGKRLDNRSENLRVVTPAQQTQNRRAHRRKRYRDKTIARGLSWFPRRQQWLATIQHRGKVLIARYFDEHEDNEARSWLEEQRLRLFPFAVAGRDGLDG